MKNLCIYAILFLLACNSLFSQNISLDQAVQSSAKTIESRLPEGAKLAILTFTSTAQNFSDYVIDELAIAISSSNKIQVIERQYTDVIRKELNIQMSGDVSDDQVRSVGQQLGAQYVVTGSLVDIGNAYRFRLSAINVETAVREGASSLSINISDPQVIFLLTGKRISAPISAPASAITNITYSGDTWPLEPDGRRKSPSVDHNKTTKTRIHFTSTTANVSITIQLWVSSEGPDILFVGNLDTTTSHSNSQVHISGESFKSVNIIIPSPGKHYIEIGYIKDGSVNQGSDCGWYKIE